jgi:thioredoxin-related protein
MRRLVVFAWMALLLARFAAAGDLPQKFEPRRDAVADVAQAVSLAAAQHKRVIVDVGGEWCSWCHILDHFIASHDDVRQLVDANYVWVKVNFSPDNKNEALLARWPKVKGYPHLFVLDAKGALLQSQNTAELEAGHDYDHAKMVAFLQRYR